MFGCDAGVWFRDSPFLFINRVYKKTSVKEMFVKVYSDFLAVLYHSQY